MVILSFYCNEEHIIVKNAPFFLRDSGAGTETDVHDIQMLSVGKTVGNSHAVRQLYNQPYEMVAE